MNVELLGSLSNMAKNQDYSEIINEDLENSKTTTVIAHLVLASHEVVDFVDEIIFSRGHRLRWIIRSAIMLRSRDWEKYKDDEDSEMRAVARDMLSAE